MESKYELLKNKDIISILDGDTQLGEVNGIKIAMPYLSGPSICELSQKLGYYQEYSWDKDSQIVNLSRWKYMENLIDFTIRNNKIDQLLSCIMSKEAFEKCLNKLDSAESIENIYKYINQKIIDKINSILYVGGNKLDIIGGRFIIKGIDSKIKVDTPNIKIIDREYVKNLSDRALTDIDNGNLDSAITKSRTLVEEVFCYAIELKEEKPSESGEIGQLYKQVKNLYNMHSDANMDKRINKILSGLEKIVSGISEIRNVGSDSHGLGNKRIGISPYHATLTVNASTTLAEFILSVAQNDKTR